MNHLNANPFHTAESDLSTPVENTPDVGNRARVSAHEYFKEAAPERKPKLLSVADAFLQERDGTRTSPGAIII